MKPKRTIKKWKSSSSWFIRSRKPITNKDIKPEHRWICEMFGWK